MKSVAFDICKITTTTRSSSVKICRAYVLVISTHSLLLVYHNLVYSQSNRANICVSRIKLLCEHVTRGGLRSKHVIEGLEVVWLNGSKCAGSRTL